MAKKLRGEFTFGFEFEGFARLEKYLRGTDAYNNYDCDFDDMECNSLDGDDYEEFYSSVNNFINSKLRAVKGRTHYDGSVKNYLDGYQSFEYSSTVYKFNAKNLKMLKEFFNNLPYYEMGVNETCGFHTHISYNGITEKDAIWIVSQIACNPEWSHEVCYFSYDENTEMNFYNQRYANKDFLKDIKETIERGNFSNIRNVINSDKYRVLRIHPQGTIEWRGPRDFLSLTYGFNRFVKKLSKIIDIFSSALEKKDLNGISKQEFFDKCEKYVDKYTINFTDINDITTFKPLIRNGVVGLCSEFNMRSIIEKNNLFNSKTAKKIADGAERNPSILCDVTLEFLYNQIFNYMSTKALKEFIQNAEKKNFNIKQKVAEQLLMINGKFLPQLVKYIPSVSLNDLAFYTDRTTFNSLTDSEIVDFSNTCLSLVSDDDLVDMAIILIRGTNRTDVVLKAIENGRFKNVDSSRLYNMSLTMKSFPINDEYKEFINSLISFKNNGLLNYSENTMVYNRDELVKNLIDSLDKFTAVCSTIDTTPRYYMAEQCECESGTVDSATNNIRISISQPLRGISVSN